MSDVIGCGVQDADEPAALAEIDEGAALDTAAERFRGHDAASACVGVSASKCIDRAPASSAAGIVS